MKPFHHCPACAADLDDPDRDHGSRCSSCGRIWYRNPSPTAGAAIVQDGKALVTVRGRDPYQGRVDVPGGFIQPGESALEGLRRELREELGVEVDVSMDDVVQIEPHRYGDEGEWTLAIGFTARIAQGEPQAADDVGDILWVGENELDALDWAWPHDKELVLRALRHERDKEEDPDGLRR